MPQVQWKADGESKYVLVLTDPKHDVATLLLHQFIPVGRGQKANGEEFTRYEEFLSRRDPAIGEDYDDLEDRLDREPKTRCLGVMVELDPITEGKKIKGFRVKTETFTRKTDDGEVEATAPMIGLCTQSAFLLWGAINSLNESLGDLIETPLQITRRGEKTNTRYDIIPFMEKPVDLAPLMEFVDGISYVGDDLEELQRAIDAEDSETAQARAVANHLLDKRIDELADAERYKEMVEPLELDDMPKNSWGRKSSKESKSKSTPARTTKSTNGGAQPDKNERFAALKQRVEQG